MHSSTRPPALPTLAPTLSQYAWLIAAVMPPKYAVLLSEYVTTAIRGLMVTAGRAEHA